MKRWMARTLATLLAASVLVVATATPAYAGWYCNNYGGDFGTFTVCIEKINNGYNALAYHGSGPTYTVDFNLVTSSGTYGSEGAFTIAAGETRTYFFAVGYKAAAEVRLYWRAGSPYFDYLWSPTAF